MTVPWGSRGAEPRGGGLCMCVFVFGRVWVKSCRWNTDGRRRRKEGAVSEPVRAPVSVRGDLGGFGRGGARARSHPLRRLQRDATLPSPPYSPLPPPRVVLGFPDLSGGRLLGRDR